MRARPLAVIEVTMRPQRLGVPGALACAMAVAACGEGGGAPVRDCEPIVWARPSRTDVRVEVVGSFNGWTSPGIALEPFEDDESWWMARVAVAPGEHGYLIDEGGVKKRDQFNPLTTFRGAEEVSLLVAPDCSAPELVVNAAVGGDAGDIEVKATLLARPGGPPMQVPVGPTQGRFRCGPAGSPRASRGCSPSSGLSRWVW